MARYIRVLRLADHTEVWYVGPVRDEFQQAAVDHDMAVYLAHVLADTLGVSVREETLAEVNAIRREKAAADRQSGQQRLVLFLCVGMYLACSLWLQVKTAKAIKELRDEVSVLHAEMDRRVTEEEMRAWVERLAKENNAVMEVPRF